MNYQAKRLSYWFLASFLSGGLAGCGVTSEVTTTHPSSSSLGAAQSMVVSPSGRSAVGEGRPHRLPDGTLSAPPEQSAAAIVVAPAAGTATSSANTRNGGELTPVAAASPAAESGAVFSRDMRTQSGRIIDEAGEPLVGATVLLKGTTRGASTDANGNYFLAVPLGTNTFVFGYSGYQDEVAQSRDGQPLTVTLLPTARPEAPAAQPRARRH
jgi:hypothetical protein